MYHNEIPSIFEFRAIYVDYVFKHGHPSVILFYKDEESALVDAFTAVAKIWKKKGGKANFVTSGLTEGIQEKLASFTEVKTVPTLMIIHPPPAGVKAPIRKYFFGDISYRTSAKEITQFVIDFFSGKLKPFQKSEPVPESSTEPV